MPVHLGPRPCLQPRGTHVCVVIIEMVTSGLHSGDSRAPCAAAPAPLCDPSWQRNGEAGSRPTGERHTALGAALALGHRLEEKPTSTSWWGFWAGRQVLTMCGALGAVPAELEKPGSGSGRAASGFCGSFILYLE